MHSDGARGMGLGDGGRRDVGGGRRRVKWKMIVTGQETWVEGDFCSYCV